MLEAIDDDRTLLTTGADSLALLTHHLLTLDIDFRIHETAALRDHVAAAARRLAAAVAHSSGVG